MRARLSLEPYWEARQDGNEAIDRHICILLVSIHTPLPFTVSCYVGGALPPSLEVWHTSRTSRGTSDQSRAVLTRAARGARKVQPGASKSGPQDRDTGTKVAFWLTAEKSVQYCKVARLRHEDAYDAGADYV